MLWNWQLPDWPHFKYDSSIISTLESSFLQGAGGSIAVLKHLDIDKKNQFMVEILCTEGITSAEIEGEILERESLQSSIRRNFGMSVNGKKVLPKEEGMANLMFQVYNKFEDRLTHEMLFDWHRALLQAETSITDIGKYRTHEDPMQIVSGLFDKHHVHFEAPPSKDVHKEMTAFINWFNSSRDKSDILGRAAITHLYFESIHPFEDGNGRIGRALVEKALSQNVGHPILIAISKVIAKKKKDYYKAISACNRTLNVDHWVKYFSEVIVQSQDDAFLLVNFLMNNSKLMNALSGRINERQEKVLMRMFTEGVEGFSGGLSAENYIAITKTSRATATRDLADLVDKKVLNKTGQLRHTRYWLNI